MRLVIRNEDDPQKPEVSLSGDKILVGHEPDECQLYLPQNYWPMVARLHAEIRILHGVCYLSDLNSDSGTFVDDRRITQSTPLRINSRVQFGKDGPTVTVLLVEGVNSLVPDVIPQPDPVHPPKPLEQHKIVLSPPIKNDQKPLGKSAYIELLSNDRANRKRLDLIKDVVQFGRSPGLDISFALEATEISRRHAEIRRTLKGGYELHDLNSFNGTLLNDKRLTSPTLLRNGDLIRLGLTGPILRFHQSRLRLSSPTPMPLLPKDGDLRSRPTHVNRVDPAPLIKASIADREPICVLPFNGRTTYSIGRSNDCEVKLDGLQVSKQHATITVDRNQIFIEDTNSTNGVYVNGLRKLSKVPISANDIVLIGPFLLMADLERGIRVFDTRAQTRIDSIGLTKVVQNSRNPGTIKLLDNINLTINPNEFVGVLGPSGAGKSTLLDALNGMRPATAGQVLVNNLDLYQHLDWLKQEIGYVPQDDIIHRELTVFRTLYFVAKLRLSEDATDSEIDSLIGEVLDVTGLTERRDLQVSELSGGQRKRVSIAVELMSKPSVIFLDEPTSGLDPATDEKIMVLFRQIADAGHTIILTTHAMANVALFDKIVILMQGKLVFYGTPNEALTHLEVSTFKDLYDKLEAPIADQVANLGSIPDGDLARNGQDQRVAQIKENVADAWKRRYQASVQYDRYISKPQSLLPHLKPASPSPRSRSRFWNALRQSDILAERYSEIMKRDRVNLMILFGQASVIAVLTWLAVASNSSRDFLYFILALVPVWFGTNVAAREIIRERAVYKRERMVNLGLGSYVGSKLLILIFIVAIQCLILFGILKGFALLGLIKLPALAGGVPQLGIMFLTGMVGIALGLFVSATVKTSETATSLVPLLLIPQILFSGLIGIPSGVAKSAGALFPVTWSFDEMKRLSANEVKVLWGKEEGGQSAFNNDGRGLYTHIRHESQREAAARERLVNRDRDDRLQESQANAKGNRTKRATDRSAPALPRSDEVADTEMPPTVSVVPEDLSEFVGFLHPWGAWWLNPLILLVMFFVWVGATLVVLKVRDAL